MPSFRSFSSWGIVLAGGLWIATDGVSQETQMPKSGPDAVHAKSDGDLIAPAKTSDSGLLLEPDLDLSWFSKERFEEEMSKVGAHRIKKQWTEPVSKLPEPIGKTVGGLPQAEIKKYMQRAKEMFLAGEAIPVSDVGLISTQEDVIRQPMLNHISAFENSEVRVYLLVQRTASDEGWGYFSIAQDMTRETPLDYYAELSDDSVRLEGTSCYKCHSSGPLAIHPAREDLVLDPKLAAALGHYIAEQPRSEFYFPEESPKPETGKPLTPSFCTSCHDQDADRATLYQVHSHSIRVLVDYGYMPPDEKLSEDEIRQLKTWLEEK